MKRVLSLLTFCGLMTATSIGQVNPSVNPDTPIWGVTSNTGIAIAPFYQWQAVVFDDPGGAYIIQWLDAASGALLDIDKQPGENPDVAYYGNADALVVAYELGGDIWVDDYYLATVSPTDYNLGSQTPVFCGENPNVDMNSSGNGVLTWECGGDVFMCCFTIGSFTPGPVVHVNSGTMPDVALMDDDDHVVSTYIQGGQLFMETYLYADLCAGGLSPSSGSVVIPPSIAGFEWPRVQTNRHSAFGPPQLYTVVAQDGVPGAYDVSAYFYNAPGGLINVQNVNAGANFCGPDNPRPVVAYDRDEVHVAWAQDYTCAGFPPIDPFELDVLMVQCDHNGNFSGGSSTPGPGMLQEVNQFDLDFTNSATSLNTEYDAFYGINFGNSFEGVVFNDPGDLFWKRRDMFNPWAPYKNSGDELEDPITIVKAPDFGQIKVTVEGMESESEVATFTLIDNSGREIELSPATQSGNVFTLDASSLSNGIYLLNCTVGDRTKTERIAHFK